MNEHDIHVRMCEVRSGQGASILRSTLGSCVGVGLLWPARGLCALAHCLLPESATRASEPSAKYVTDAIPSLLKIIGATPAHHHQLEAVIAGGACMVRRVGTVPYALIGEQNSQMAERLIAEAGIRVVHTDIGGTSGRQLNIECGTQRYAIRTFDRLH